MITPDNQYIQWRARCDKNNNTKGIIYPATQPVSVEILTVTLARRPGRRTGWTGGLAAYLLNKSIHHISNAKPDWAEDCGVLRSLHFNDHDQGLKRSHKLVILFFLISFSRRLFNADREGLMVLIHSYHVAVGLKRGYILLINVIWCIQIFLNPC